MSVAEVSLGKDLTGGTRVAAAAQRRWERWALLALAVGAGTLLGIGRRWESTPFRSLYAEDGQIFLSAALSKSPAGAFMEPYAGYFHTVPRTIAEVASLAPLDWAPGIMAVSAALVVALTAIVVFYASADLLRSSAVRAILAAGVILVPVGAAEVADNVANLHWFLIFASFWVLLWRPRSGPAIAAGCAVLAAAALSDPLTILLAPVAVVRLVKWRRPLDAFLLTLTVGLLVQGAAIALAHPRRDLHHAASPVQLAVWYAQDVLGRGLFGSWSLGDPHSRPAIALTGVAVVILLALAAIAWRAGCLGRRPMAILAAAMSVVVFVGPVGLTGIAAPRYAVAPVLLLMSAIALVYDDLGRVRTRAVQVAKVAAVTILALAWLTNVVPAASAGPSWSGAVSAAREDCSHRPPTQVETLPIAPAGWEITLACSTLQGHR